MLKYRSQRLLQRTRPLRLFSTSADEDIKLPNFNDNAESSSSRVERMREKNKPISY